MIVTLKKVLPAMERAGIRYMLGDESLLGLTEGDFEKYIFNPVFYILPSRINWLRYVILAFNLIFQGITVKPKWVYRHFRLKIRRKQGLSQKSPNFIFFLPLRATHDSYEIVETGRRCVFSKSDLFPLERFIQKDVSFSVPRNLDRFVDKYRDELLSNSYRKHPATFDRRSAMQAEQILFDVANILNQQKSHWWLEGGTLLGLYRDGKLLDWDHDVDLGVRFDSQAQISALLTALRKLPYYVKVLDFPNKTGLWNLGEVRLMKLFPRRFYFFHSELCLDLFIFYREDLDGSDTPVYKYVVHERNGYHPADLLDALSVLSFKGHSLGRPEKTEDFLRSKYGETWDTPVKEWHVAIDDKTILNNMDTNSST